MLTLLFLCRIQTGILVVHTNLELNSRLHFIQLGSKCTLVSEPWPPQGFLDIDLQGMQAQTCATFSA